MLPGLDYQPSCNQDDDFHCYYLELLLLLLFRMIIARTCGRDWITGPPSQPELFIAKEAEIAKSLLRTRD